MIVLYPNRIAYLAMFRNVLRNVLRKSLVEPHIVVPGAVLVGFTFGAIGNLVIEDRPEDGLAVRAVSIKVTVAYKHRQGPILVFEFLLNGHPNHSPPL